MFSNGIFSCLNSKNMSSKSLRKWLFRVRRMFTYRMGFKTLSCTTPNCMNIKYYDYNDVVDVDAVKGGKQTEGAQSGKKHLLGWWEGNLLVRYSTLIHFFSPLALQFTFAKGTREREEKKNLLRVFIKN